MASMVAIDNILSWNSLAAATSGVSITIPSLDNGAGLN